MNKMNIQWNISSAIRISTSFLVTAVGSAYLLRLKSKYNKENEIFDILKSNYDVTTIAVDDKTLMSLLESFCKDISLIEERFKVRIKFAANSLNENDTANECESVITLTGFRHNTISASAELKKIITDIQTPRKFTKRIPTHLKSFLLDILQEWSCAHEEETCGFKQTLVTYTTVFGDHSKIMAALNFKLTNYYSERSVSPFELPKLNLSYSVFVSAVRSPNMFWVQLVNQSDTSLDDIQDQLSAEKQDPGNLLPIADELTGVCCMAPFQDDSECFYRAVIVENTDDANCSVDYLDYGDVAIVSRLQLFELKPQYCILPAQSIACRLSGVDLPRLWTQEETEKFKEVTFFNLWKPLQAKFVSKSTDDIFTVELIHPELNTAVVNVLIS